MKHREKFRQIEQELQTAIDLVKCQKCGCLQETLEHLVDQTPDLEIEPLARLQRQAEQWRARMQPVQYDCLGCDPCYPAVAQNLLVEALPRLEQVALSCRFEVNEATWPPVAGEYFVLDETAPVAVSTLASVQLAADLAQQPPLGLAIVGKTETENIGLDKIIKNMITNPALRYLIVCGVDSQGHQTGRSLLALAQNGVDAGQRIIGSPGKRPVLRNVTLAEIEQFRAQVELIDLIGCESLAQIRTAVEALASAAGSGCGCHQCGPQAEPAESSRPAPVLVSEPEQPVKLDKAGYFVILPQPARRLISVEYYRYDHTLVQTLEGPTARVLYLALIERGWVTALTHAAYLGKELARAELALTEGIPYVQDGA